MSCVNILMNFKPKIYLWAPLQKKNNNDDDKNMARYIEEFKSYKKVNFKNVCTVTRGIIW